MTDDSPRLATTPGGIADELNAACESVRAVDYNALTDRELSEILTTLNTLQELCLAYRRRQHNDRERRAPGDDTS